MENLLSQTAVDDVAFGSVIVADAVDDVSVGDVSFQRRKSLAIEKFEQVFHLFLTIGEKNGSIEKITLPCILKRTY